jgi:hypothetical protein
VGLVDGDLVGVVDGVTVGVPGDGGPDPPGLGDGDGPQMMIGSGEYLVCKWLTFTTTPFCDSVWVMSIWKPPSPADASQSGRGLYTVPVVVGA